MPQNFSFKAGYNVDLIVERLKQGRKIRRDGSVIFEGLDHDDWRLVALSALNVNDGITELLAIRTIQKALFSKRLSPGFDGPELEKECRRQFAALKRLGEKEFIFYFEIPLLSEPPVQWTTRENCRIHFSSSPFSKFIRDAKRERSSFMVNRGRHYGLKPVECLSAPVRIRVLASDEWLAYPIARDGFDEVRGIMNFALNWGVMSRISSPPRPVNYLKSGPFITVHDKRGKIVSDAFWYDPDWQQPSKDHGKNKKLKKLGSQFRHINKRVKMGHGLSRSAAACFREYCRALDQSQWQNSFLHLWTVLEFLTNTKNADYEKTVRRAASMHHDFDGMREIGRHLRYRRNQIVHTALEYRDAEALIFQTMRLVHPLLRFYVNNPFGFCSRDDVSDFLDLPRAMSELQKQKKFIEVAERFRR